MDRTTRIAQVLRASRRVAKTLYHGTTVDNEESIRHHGLMGGVGKFVKYAYGEYATKAGIHLPDLVFAADKKGLARAVTAMAFHIGRKLGKYSQDVTDNDILNYGLLVIIYDPEGRVKQRPEDYIENPDYSNHPIQVEQEDYYAESLEGDKFVKGSQLLRLLKRYNQWPRRWGPVSLARLKYMKGWLINMALRSNPEKTKYEVIERVKGLSDDQVERYFLKHKYQGYSHLNFDLQEIWGGSAVETEVD